MQRKLDPIGRPEIHRADAFVAFHRDYLLEQHLEFKMNE